MVREIKFRVWDKLTKTFIFADKGYQGHYMLTLNGKFYDLHSGSGGDECVVQQYTGLKDKNGREIFEGDILRLTYRDIYEIRENGKFVKWSDKEKELHSFYEVGFFNDEFTVNCDEYTILINGWGVKLIRSDDNEDFLIGKINPIGGKIKKQNCGGYGFNSEFLEIVGNILENPDLLAE